MKQEGVRPESENVEDNIVCTKDRSGFPDDLSAPSSSFSHYLAFKPQDQADHRASIAMTRLPQPNDLSVTVERFG